MRLPPWTNSRLVRYGVAVAAVALAALARALLPAMGPGYPFMTFFPAVVIAALIGGAGPGVLALVLSMAASAVWMRPAGEGVWPGPGGWTALAAFGSIGALLVFVGHLARSWSRRAAASALEAAAADRQLRVIFERTWMGLAEADAATHRLTRVSRRLCDMLGYREEELLGRMMDEITHPEDRGLVGRAFEAGAAGPGPGAGTPPGGPGLGGAEGWHAETRFLRRDGGEVWAQVYAALIRDASGRPERVVAAVHDISERRAAEERVRRSERRLRAADAQLRAAMRSGEVGTWELDPPSGRVACSESADLMFGLEPGRERPLADYLPRVHRDDRDRFARAVADAVDGVGAGAGGALAIDFRVVRAGGEVRWIAARGEVARDPGATAAPGGRGAGLAGARLIGAVFDITERKAAELAIATREHSYRELFESTTDAILVGDDRGVYVDANPAAAAMLGLPLASLIGRQSRDFVPASAKERAEEASREIRRTGAWSGELPMVRADGVPIIVEYRSRHAGGRTVGFARDVTERRRAEEAAARLAAIVESTDDAVIGKTLDGVITSWNGGAERLLGFAASEMIGRPAGALVPAERADEEASILSRLRAGERVAPFDTVRLHRDGSTIDVSVSSSPVRDAGGRLIGAATIAHDIRARRRAEAMLLESNERLERAVEARTRELGESHARLRHSERMAGLGTLAAGVGHDLANLVLPIRVSLEALADAAGPAAAGEARAIANSLDYLAQLAQGLRLLARDPGDAAPTELVDVAEWWGGVEALMRNPLPRGVALDGSVPAGLPPVCITVAALTQAVFNLVQNAGDALRERGGRVRVFAEAAPGGFVRLRVADDGPGMTEEVRLRCFEPYFSTKPRGLSTGLGLSFSRGLVERAGGSISCESEPGRGAVFTLDLPVVGSRRGAPARRGAAVSVRDPRSASILRSVLPTFGFEARPADGAADALVWIVDDGCPGGEVARFLEADPSRAVLLVARESVGHASARVTAVGNPMNLGLVRERLRALAASVQVEAAGTG